MSVRMAWIGAALLVGCSSSSSDGNTPTKDSATDVADSGSSAKDSAADVRVDSSADSSVDSGPLITCTSTSGSGTPDGHCEINATKCDDGHAYSIVCDAGVCNCLVDGTPNGVHPTVTNCLPTNDVEMGKSCGWNLG